MVVLDPDVAQVFITSAAANAVLRALITTMPNTAARSEDLAQPLEVYRALYAPCPCKACHILSGVKGVSI